MTIERIDDKITLGESSYYAAVFRTDGKVWVGARRETTNELIGFWSRVSAETDSESLDALFSELGSRLEEHGRELEVWIEGWDYWAGTPATLISLVTGVAGGLEGTSPASPGDGRTAQRTKAVFANPRLTDALGLELIQEQVDFAIPHLQEDLPFALDPFLLWKSDDAVSLGLHAVLLDFFEQLRALLHAGSRTRALEMLLRCREATELGLGFGKGTKRGTALGPGLGNSILDVFAEVPQLWDEGLTHIETLGLVVPLVAEDRISDIAASILRNYLIDYTSEQATLHAIPRTTYRLDDVWDPDIHKWRSRSASLPSNPIDGSPLLFAPLRLLRHLTWINYPDYYKSSFARLVLPADAARRVVRKAAVLERNRRTFVAVERYVSHKEETADACEPDPLFEPLKLSTLRRKLAELKKLPAGREEGADKRYESLASDLLSSLLYPELDFAADQVRTVSGAHIRDLVFYNDGKTEFLRDIKERHGARQLVFELKNVQRLSGEHVNQLHRYLDDEVGHLGVLVTRRPPVKAVETNIVDLHSSKRVVILILDDSDLSQMVELANSARRPSDVLKKRYIEFTRRLPK